jgi:hypothetical protein
MVKEVFLRVSASQSCFQQRYSCLEKGSRIAQLGMNAVSNFSEPENPQLTYAPLILQVASGLEQTARGLCVARPVQALHGKEWISGVS